MEKLPIFGPWEAIEKLGKGGMCVVYRARHRDEPSRECAVKVLTDRDLDAVERFAAEARLLQRIDHPNVIRVHELDAEARPAWLTMDLLSGRDLDEEREVRPFETERAARVIADVADGLSAVHALGVRHRDIKPANIMVGTDGVPRLIDFGIARKITDAHRTQTGFVVGTAAYMPPEVYLGENPQAAQDTETADVYALGQTLCELLIGEPIYPREGDTTLLVRIMRDKMDRPSLDPRQWRPSVPDALADIVIAGTRQEPTERLQTAAELADSLRAWVATRQSVESAPVSQIDPRSLPAPPSSPPPPPGADRKAPPTTDLAGMGLDEVRAAGASEGPPPLPDAPPPLPDGPPPLPDVPPPLPDAAPTPPASAAKPPMPPAQPPPKPKRSTPTPAGARQRGSAPPPAPAGGGGGVMAMMAGGGLFVVIGLSAVTALGVAGLWVMRPAPPPAPVSSAEIQAAVVRQSAALEPCVPGHGLNASRAHGAHLDVTWVVHDGGALYARIDKTDVKDPAVDKCVTDAISTMTFPTGASIAVTVPIELQ